MKKHLVHRSFSEYFVFLFYWAFYFTIGYFFAKNTLLAHHPLYVHDLYLGFDNVLQNTSFIRHPLVKIFSLSLNYALAFLADKSFIIVCICSFLLALQMVFIYKILKQIIKLSLAESLFIVVFYSAFSANLVLSFTMESYVFSICFLPIFFYFIADYQNRKEAIPPKLFYFFAILIGGITITNILKIFAGIYNYPKSIILKRLAIIFATLGIIYLLLLPSTVASISHSAQFIHQSGDYFLSVVYLFLGGGVVFPHLSVTDLDYENIGQIPAIIAEIPNNLAKTFVIVSVLFLVLFSFIYNFKQPLVKILFLSFSVDIFIHLIIGLGISEAHIFSGNFIFIYPLLIAFLLKNLRNQKLKFGLMALVLCLLIIISFHNYKDMMNIYHFGTSFYLKD